MKTGGNFETSEVGPLGILVAVVMRKIGQGSRKSGIFVGVPSTSPFPAIFLNSDNRDTTKEPMNNMREILFL